MIDIWIIGDQLLAHHPAIVYGLQQTTKDQIRIVLIESFSLQTEIAHHRKKLVLLFSAMRHYAQKLEQDGFHVVYKQCDTFLDGWQEISPQQIITMKAASYQGVALQEQVRDRLSVPMTLLENTQFLTGQYNPIPNPLPEKRYVMESFYRQMRRHFSVLMDGDDPVTGQWNYDADNRKKLPKTDHPPQDIGIEPDEITRQVMQEIEGLPIGVGSAENFQYAVTREDALMLFDRFLQDRMGKFGKYEDALTNRSHSVYHSVLSPYLNIGLLTPLELVRKVEDAYVAGEIPINSAEGFIRQLIGWREFMYWQYWRQGEAMLSKNGWNAHHTLPEFVWTGETDMGCMRYAIGRAIDTGYNHHIERLMVLSNFFMLTQINPRKVNDWFMSMYIDAFEWVMPPNVIGMSLNADGGLTATKPYIASANYINKMGDHCKSCRFNPKKRHGEDACPFNYLYWNFILTHEERLRANPRTSRNVLGLRHLSDEDRQLVQAETKQFIQRIGVQYEKSSD